WILKENDLQEQGTFTIRTVPKSIRSYDEEYYKIISNFEDNDSKAKVDKLMYYLDIDIMSQIIGTLWVMMIGKDLEEEYIDYVAGNLLEQDMDKNNLKLFKPYYLSYERWRDDAINIIENRLKNGNRSTMLSLDIKEYYYSINLDIEYYKKKIIKKYKIRKFLDNNISENDIEKLDEFKVFKYINDYVFNVIRAYSKAMNLRKINNERNGFRNILPIGFLPSSILSNLYLSDFDKSVNKILSPLYYKRYVDDILIVLNTDYKKQEKFKNEDILNKKFYENELFEIGVLVNNSLENNKTLSKINRKKEKDKTEIIVLNSIDNFMNFIKKIDRDDIELKKNILNILKKYIIRDKFENDEFKSWKKTNPIEKKCNIEEVEKNLKYINEKLIIKSSKFKKIYLLKEYIKNKESYLVIQDEKVRIYDFSSSGSKALIENFKKEIAKNSSVFKFLPQKDEVLNNFDSEVYKLEYKDSINKLSSISEFKINRYNLSKFLARIIYSDKLENADYINDVNEKISWIFEGKYAV
ncbi:reverse transcriptase domain-containing protein, partial [Clostridium perfringens]